MAVLEREVEGFFNVEVAGQAGQFGGGMVMGYRL
jgi:hypothetical protein